MLAFLTLALTWLRRIPSAAYFALLLFGVSATAQHWYTRRLAQATAAGRDGERAKAAALLVTYAAQIVTLQSRRDSIARVVDTLWRTTRATATTATTAIAAVPQPLRDTMPAIDAALDACETLIADVARLTKVRLTERTVARELHTLDSTALHALAGVVVATRDTVQRRTRERDRRPRWRTVAKAGAVAAGVGVAVGRYVLVPRTRR